MRNVKASIPSWLRCSISWYVFGAWLAVGGTCSQCHYEYENTCVIKDRKHIRVLAQDQRVWEKKYSFFHPKSRLNEVRTRMSINISTDT